MEKFVMAQGVPIRYSDYGKGDKIVCLLHGYLRSIETWDSFGGALGKQFRVITIDLPGHGMSDWGGRAEISIDFMADVVSEVLVKAGVEKCCMVGHSMGGYVAAAMAQRHAEQLNSVVFFHSTPNNDPPQKIELRKREIEAIRAGRKELLASVNPGLGIAPQNAKRCQDVIDEFAEQIMMMEDEAIVATLEGLMLRQDRNAVVASLQIPVLFIFGKLDVHISVEAVEALIEKQPAAQIAWLERSSHYGFIEQPEESLEIISGFLNSSQAV